MKGGIESQCLVYYSRGTYGLMIRAWIHVHSKQEVVLSCVFVTRVTNSMWKYIQVLILIFKVRRRHGFSHAFQIFSAQSNQKKIVKIMNSSEHELK